MAEAAPRWAAPALALAVAGACFAAYQHAPRALAEVAIVPYALLLAVAPAPVYAWMRLRGAGPGAATAGGLLLWGAWLVKEGVRVQKLHGLGGALYYAANPLSLGIVLGAVFQMTIVEWALRRAGASARRGPGPLLALGAVLLVGGAMALVSVRYGSSQLFYRYVDGYAWLFGS